MAQEVRRVQKEKNNPNAGFDVRTEQYSDMIADGIIDPAKVTRSALHLTARRPSRR